MLKSLGEAILFVSLLSCAASSTGSGSGFGSSGDRNARSADLGEKARRPAPGSD